LRELAVGVVEIDVGEDLLRTADDGEQLAVAEGDEDLVGLVGLARLVLRVADAEAVEVAEPEDDLRVGRDLIDDARVALEGARRGRRLRDEPGRVIADGAPRLAEAEEEERPERDERDEREAHDEAIAGRER